MKCLERLLKNDNRGASPYREKKKNKCQSLGAATAKERSPNVVEVLSPLSHLKYLSDKYFQKHVRTGFVILQIVSYIELL